jgi:hypothetical protein
MSAFEDVDNSEYKYFNYNIAVEDSFAKRGLDQTEKSLSPGLKEQVEIQQAYLTKYIEEYLKNDGENLTENEKNVILDIFLDNFHTLVHFFFFPNLYTKKNFYYLPLPIYLPIYSVIDFMLHYKQDIIKQKGLIKYSTLSDNSRMELFKTLYKKYNMQFKEYIIDGIIPRNVSRDEKKIIHDKQMFFYNYELYETNVKTQLKEQLLKKNVNQDNFNNPQLDYAEAFDTGFDGGKKKRAPHKKTTRKHKKNKRKQRKGKSRNRKP